MGGKVTIIGAGSVGSTIAYTMAVKGLASEIVLVDVNEGKALGEALDIRQGTPLMDSPANVYAGEYQNTAGSDVVVITSGVARKPGQTRIDLAQTNVNILKQIAPEIVRYAPDAVYVIVSNPVDVLTYVFQKVTGIPKERVIGSGTLLDTARLRARVAEYLDVSQKNVHAYVLGEHGDTSFIPWSLAKVSGVPLADCESVMHRESALAAPLNYEEIETYMRTSGGKIIKRKGATFYAIALAVCNVYACLTGGVNAIMAVSTLANGEYGIDDVALSMPTIVGPGGVKGKLTPPLTDEEVAKYRASAAALRAAIDQISY